MKYFLPLLCQNQKLLKTAVFRSDVQNLKHIEVLSIKSELCKAFIQKEHFSNVDHNAEPEAGKDNKDKSLKNTILRTMHVYSEVHSVEFNRISP